MAIEVGSERVICPKCGMAYGRRKGNFSVSYAYLYKGSGYIPICRECVDDLYNMYFSQCKSEKDAVRQVCRKLDLFWSEKIFESIFKKTPSRSIMTQYIAKTNSNTYAGRCYDDTLSSEGSLWDFESDSNSAQITTNDIAEEENSEKDTLYEQIDPNIISFWGAGYTPEMYQELEQKREYWTSRFPKDVELDVGTEAIIKQICGLELDISRDRAAGRSVDKSINALNSLLGSANMKPAQRKNEDTDADLASIPLGVWLYKYENKRPLPEIDEQLKDVNGVKKYVFTWLGHLCKMLGIKNGYTKLYNEEIERLRVTRPEYQEDEEEDLIIDSYSEYTESHQSDDVEDA